MRLAKYRDAKGRIVYGRQEGSVLRAYETGDAGALFSLLREGREPDGGVSSPGEITLLAPADEGRNIYCAGLNYRDHAREVRMPIPSRPVFFTKAPGSLNGPCGDIPFPEGVMLLDYEVELAVVVGRRIGRGDVLARENLADYLLGLAILNDVSARDVQLARGQWFLGKSFRGFAPLGPALQTIDGDVLARMDDLSLELWVEREGPNSAEKRQSGNTRDMIFGIADLANSLSRQFDLLPGDVIATGTPKGVALGSPTRWETRLAEILGIPPARRMARFLERERRSNPAYLKRGDLIRSTIRSADGVVDLGEQVNRVI